MLQYRPLRLGEGMRIAEINWTDRELPNGFAWHLRWFRDIQLEFGL